MSDLTKEEESVLMQKLVGKLASDPRLTDWEKEFLENIKQQIISRDLTGKQLAVLNKIKKRYLKT